VFFLKPHDADSNTLGLFLKLGDTAFKPRDAAFSMADAIPKLLGLGTKTDGAGFFSGVVRAEPCCPSLASALFYGWPSGRHPE
tara:strand:- start:915 stop:1163 length:249 start_codon:yes stop_codon:yes gene_type:complete